MSSIPIEKMSFEQLRIAVRELSDDLARFKRNYNDTITNLDYDNFSTRLIKDKNGMQSEIKQTAEEISLKVSSEDLSETLLNYTTLSLTDDKIQASATTVKNYVDDEIEITKAEIIAESDIILARVGETYETQENAQEKYSEIKQTASEIDLKVTNIANGEYTEELLDKYLTGIKILPKEVQIYDGSALRCYSGGQIEGWTIEPDSLYGGLLKYYVNGNCCYEFGSGEGLEDSYTDTDMVLKALGTQRGRFVVDVTKSGYKEVKFVGMNKINGNSNIPAIYANEMLLATKDWVEQDAVLIAKFGV